MTETDSNEIKTEIEEIIEEEDNNMSTIAQIFIEKGRVEGEAKAEARAIIRTLTKRFQKIPAPLKERILTITDLDRLEYLANLAFDCESLEEFADSLE